MPDAGGLSIDWPADQVERVAQALQKVYRRYLRRIQVQGSKFEHVWVISCLSLKHVFLGFISHLMSKREHFPKKTIDECWKAGGQGEQR